MIDMKYAPPSFLFAERWLAIRIAELTEKFSGMYIVINIDDCSYATGTDHKRAFKAYALAHGPTPNVGRSFVCKQL